MGSSSDSGGNAGGYAGATVVTSRGSLRCLEQPDRASSATRKAKPTWMKRLACMAASLPEGGTGAAEEAGSVATRRATGLDTLPIAGVTRLVQATDWNRALQGRLRAFRAAPRRIRQ